MADGFPPEASAPYTVTDEDRAAYRRYIGQRRDRRAGPDPGQYLRLPGKSWRSPTDVLRLDGAAEASRCARSGATPERPNIIGTHGGKGVGKNLLFTAHLDTEAPTWNPTRTPTSTAPTPSANPEWEKCWLEDGKLYGYPIANDRGPMSCFLIAAKALKKAGYELAGKMYLTACPGEIGPVLIEEHRGVAYMGKDIGAHYLFHHGGVAPDYAIAAEGCDFGLTWVGCGYAVFRFQVWGEGVHLVA